MRRYAKTHEWVRPEGPIAYVGLSDHAQKEVTDVVYVEVPKTGRTLKAGDEAATIESVKAAFSIYAPVSGTLVKANADLEKDPGLINQSPFEKGWMFAIEMSNPSEVENLMTEEQYQDFLKSPEAAGHP
ncbi:MAG: glycine cleavage system protein H [Elusimicrobia bacterium RIFCSPLOWO2_01_FULL_59_12]|nr:MAG: glycine cleavage system protein H [Elusimicrobia bacterium RIFCSPLOWO2_01_FULL_59_12]